MTREIIISADCHATAPREQFTEYLDPAWRDEHASWAATVADTPQSSNPHPQIDERVNWDSELRLAGLETEGTVAEVIYPNNLPFGYHCLESDPSRTLSAGHGRAPHYGSTTDGWRTSVPLPRDVALAARSYCSTTSTKRSTPSGKRPSAACTGSCFPALAAIRGTSNRDSIRSGRPVAIIDYRSSNTPPGSCRARSRRVSRR